MNTLKGYWYVLFFVFLLPVAAYASAENQVVINFSKSDISSVYSETDELFWIRLNEEARVHLKKTSQESYGSVFEIDIEGVTVLQTRIHATIESGIIRIDNPADDVRIFLENHIFTQQSD